jgi:hypothetical protein
LGGSIDGEREERRDRQERDSPGARVKEVSASHLVLD